MEELRARPKQAALSALDMDRTVRKLDSRREALPIAVMRTMLHQAWSCS
jgi:hypothetical protein